MRDFICRNCYKKSKAEWGGQIFCRRSTCLDKDEKSRDAGAGPRRVYKPSGTSITGQPSFVIGKTGIMVA